MVGVEEVNQNLDVREAGSICRCHRCCLALGENSKALELASKCAARK